MASPRARTPGTPRTPTNQNADPTAALTAQTFDFLPMLHALLSRLVPDTPGLPQPSQADGTAASTTDDASTAGAGHLEIQQLGPAASGIKIKIQKARAALKGLPDADRTVEDQQEDIRLLEERIAKMRDMLNRFTSTTDGDIDM